MKCGILLNDREYLLPYARWLVDNQHKFGYSVSGVHSPRRPWTSMTLYKTFDEIIDSSDIVVSLGYWKVIGKETIDKVPMGIINFHHSYKLQYKGRHAATWVIRNKEKLHGSTMHFIDEHLDCGKIIDTDCFIVNEDDTAESVFKKSNEIGFRLLRTNFPKIVTGATINYQQPVQDSFTYKEEDLSHEIKIGDPDTMLREIRSLTFTGCPLPYIMLNGRKISMKLENYE